MVLLKNIKGCPTKTNGKSWPLPEILGIFCYLKMTNWILNIIVLPHYTELKISTCPRCFSVHYLETKLFSLFYSTHCMNINSHILFNFEYFLVVRFLDSDITSILYTIEHDLIYSVDDMSLASRSQSMEDGMDEGEEDLNLFIQKTVLIWLFS